MTRQHGNVAEVGAIAAVGQDSAGANEPASLAGEAAEHAVAKNHLEIVGVLVSQWCCPIQRFKLVPVDFDAVVAPHDRHRDPNCAVRTAAYPTTFALHSSAISSPRSKPRSRPGWRRPRGS